MQRSHTGDKPNKTRKDKSILRVLSYENGSWKDKKHELTPWLSKIMEKSFSL